MVGLWRFFAFLACFSRLTHPALAQADGQGWIRIGPAPEDEDPFGVPTLIVGPHGADDADALARSFVDYTDPLERLDERRADDRWKSKFEREHRGGNPSPERESDNAIVVRWLAQTIEFIRGFAGGEEDRNNQDFEASYLQRMKWQWTEEQGWIWVVRVSQSSLWTGNLRIDRQGGGVGFQMPLLGAKTIELRSGQGQLLLRVLPLAGTYRSVYAKDPKGVGYTRSDASRGWGAVQATPGAELEGSVHWTGDFSRLTTGARILAQNWVTDDHLFRVVAELYLRLDLKVRAPWVRKMSLVPRCLFERHREEEQDDWSTAIREAAAAGSAVTRCFLSLDMLIGP